MEHHFTYQAVLAASEKVHWRVEDLIGGDKQLDFSQVRSCRSRLARVEPLDFPQGGQARAQPHPRP